MLRNNLHGLESSMHKSVKYGCAPTFFFLLFLMYTYVYWYSHTSRLRGRPESLFHIISFRSGSLTPYFIFDRLDAHQTSRTRAYKDSSIRIGVHTCLKVSWFYEGTWDSNWSPHNYTVGTLLNEPSLQL